MKKSLLTAAVAAILIPGVSTASESWQLNYADANTAGALGIALNNQVSAVTDEYKVTLESVLGFTDNAADAGTANAGVISAGDTFVDHIYFSINNLFAGGSDTFDVDNNTNNTQLTGVIEATGTQIDALNYTVDSAAISFYFDGPQSGGTDAQFSNLATFTDGLLVQTGTGAGAGVNSALIPNGASNINFSLNDILSTLGQFDEFELFTNPNLSLDQIVFETGSDNAACEDSVPVIGVPCFATEAGLFAASGDANVYDFTFHVRSDGSAIKALAAVPEPSSILMLGIGLFGMGRISRRRA